MRDVIFKTYRDVNIFKGSTRDKLIRACQAALPDQIEIIIRDGICDGELAPADPRRLAWMYVAMGRPTPSEFSETK